MAASMIRRMARPFQKAARRFLELPEEENYIGANGCVNTGASFTSWNQVEGDYLEFGVFEGASFAAAYRAVHKARHDQAAFGDGSAEYKTWQQTRPRFFAFDSFEGLPEGSAARQVDYQPGAYYCSEDNFKRNISEKGVELKDVITVPGFYDKTLTRETKEKYGLNRAALVMIDCDLYESTVPVLNFLTDIVGQGSVIIFHDWFRFKGSPMCGEQRACREWQERNPQFQLLEYWREGPQAVSFLVNFR